MSAVGIVEGNDAVIDSLSFDANGLATDAVTLAAANGSEFRNVDFKGARRHGLFGGTTGNNNKIRLSKCTARYNGTSFTGRATIAKGETRIQFSEPLDLAALEETGSYLALGGVQPSILIVDHFEGPTSARVVFGPMSSATNVDFTIYSGNGFDVSHHSDGNIWDFSDCYAVGNHKAGFDIKPLYGPIMTNPQSDSNFVGLKIGTRGATDGAAPSGTQVYRGYFEGNHIGVAIENSHGTTLIDPVISQQDDGVWAPDSVGYRELWYTQGGSTRLYNQATGRLQDGGRVYAHSGNTLDTGTVVGSSGQYEYRIVGIDCIAVALSITAYGGGENGADAGAVSYYLAERSKRGAVLVLRNLAKSAQSIQFDIVASGK